MKNYLIVVDMQNDFIDGSLGTKEAVAIVDKVAEKIRSFDGGGHFYTRDTHAGDYLETQEGKKAAGCALRGGQRGLADPRGAEEIRPHLVDRQADLRLDRARRASLTAENLRKGSAPSRSSASARISA